MSLVVFHDACKFSLLLDTGSVVNIMAEEALSELETQLGVSFPLQAPPYRLMGVDGVPFNLRGVVTIPFQLARDTPIIQALFYIVPGFALAADGLIGLPLLREYGLNLILTTNSVVWNGKVYCAMPESEPILRALARGLSPTAASHAYPMQTQVHTSPQTPRSLPPKPVASDDSPSPSSSSPSTLSEVLANAREASAVVVSCRQLLPDELTRVTVRLPGVCGGVDAISLPESVRVKGVSLESTLATVSQEGLINVLVHNHSKGVIKLKSGVCLGKCLAYPSTVTEELLPPLPKGGMPVGGVSTGVPFMEQAKSQLNKTDFVEQVPQLLQLLERNREAVALKGEPLGHTTRTQHHIPLKPGTNPIYVPAYRLPHSQRKLADDMVKEMIDQGIVQDSNSPWNSPLFLVPKKDGTMRPVIDYRRLNAETVPDRYPLPHLTDLLQSLGEGNSVFSSLDLLSGYWQVPLHPESSPLTAFSTPDGHYEFVRLPFGLRNAPLCFQRLINEVFKGLLGNTVFAYLDDVVVVSKDINPYTAGYFPLDLHLTRARQQFFTYL